MTLPRLAAILAGLVLPVLAAAPAQSAPRHTTAHRAPAHVVMTTERPASVQLVSRHRHHHRRHIHRAPRRF